jgi:uncharacterized membrane protein
MKFYHSPLWYTSMLIVIFSIWLNIRMFAIQAYPTYIFFALLFAGVIMLLLDIVIRRAAQSFKSKFLIQAIASCVAIIIIYFILSD